MFAESVTVCPLREEDVDAVLAIEAQLHPVPWTRGNFIDSLRAGHGMWLAAEGGAMVGYAVITQVIDEAHLLNITIVAERQGQGVGGRFLEWLAATLRAAGARRLFLEVRPSNPAARRLYDRHGFIEIGRRKGYYPALEGREDAIVMARNL